MSAKLVDVTPSRPNLRRPLGAGSELSEIRTVHTRAVTALNYLHDWLARSIIEVDPDIREMIDALHKVDLLLAPWAKKHPKVPKPLAPLPTREEILKEFVR